LSQTKKNSGGSYTRGRSSSAWGGVTIAITIALLLVMPLVAGGCGTSTPSQAVLDFLQARNQQEWENLLASVLPEDVRKMTNADIDYRHDAWLKGNYVVEGVGTTTTVPIDVKYTVTEKDLKTTNVGQTRARVKLVAGKILVRDRKSKRGIMIDLKNRVDSVILLRDEKGKLIGKINVKTGEVSQVGPDGKLGKPEKMFKPGASGEVSWKEVMSTILGGLQVADQLELKDEFTAVKYKGAWYVKYDMAKPKPQPAIPQF